MLAVKEAIDIILTYCRQYGTEKVSIEKAYLRVLAGDVLADRDYPPFNRSAMDGYAVVSKDFDTTSHPVKLSVTQKLFAGEMTDVVVASGTCIKIMTGAPVPEGADAVIRVEDTEEDDGLVVFKITEVRKNQNIALQAEDAGKGDVTIAANTQVDASAIAVLAVTGNASIDVHKIPSIAVISTGNEVIRVDEAILPYQIRDSNSYSIKSFFRKYAVEDIDQYHFKDSREQLEEGLKKLLNKDILILSGGVSKGDADYVPEVLMSLGVQQQFHRVKIKPGAPLWFGKLPNGGVVFGLPGNPVSVQIALKVFIEPYLRACMGMQQLSPMFLPLMEEKKKKTKFDEYFPCFFLTENKLTGLVPKKMNGSGDISATLGSEGIALHPENIDLMKKGDVLAFYKW